MSERGLELLRQLDEDGYVVVEGVISPEDCRVLVAEFEETMRLLVPGLDINDSSTYTQDKLPPNQRNLLQHYNIGFWKHAVHTRTKVKSIFADIFGTQDLLTSFDATSFSAKNKTSRMVKDASDWADKAMHIEKFHLDETRDLKTLRVKSIQSGVALVDQHEDGHVFVCIPGGHLHYEEIMACRTVEINKSILEDREKHDQKKPRLMPATIKKRKMEDEMIENMTIRYNNENWWVLDDKAKTVLMNRDLRPKRVPLKAGSMVLWLSHLPHTSSHYFQSAPSDAKRLQVFVSMVPRSVLTHIYREIYMREFAYKNGRVSKHSADVIRLFPKRPRTYSKEQQEKADNLPSIPSYDGMTLEEKKLHGVESL